MCIRDSPTTTTTPLANPARRGHTTTQPEPTRHRDRCHHRRLPATTVLTVLTDWWLAQSVRRGGPQAGVKVAVHRAVDPHLNDAESVGALSDDGAEVGRARGQNVFDAMSTADVNDRGTRRCAEHTLEICCPTWLPGLQQLSLI